MEPLSPWGRTKAIGAAAIAAVALILAFTMEGDCSPSYRACSDELIRPYYDFLKP
jgi:hypothetical protein